jgi:isopenicillin N synthase-like dioxygenase
VFQEPNGAPGLQVYLPSSAVSTPDAVRSQKDDSWQWYDAPVPPPGGFLVNVGLGMELWSSGTYKATLHRVIFPEHQREALDDRYTLGFFVQPDDDVVSLSWPHLA